MSLDATDVAGVVRLADVPEITDAEPVVAGLAPAYATSVRATFAEAPSSVVTVEPPIPAGAVRANTHDVMSGPPSACVPSSVHPIGAVAVVAALAVTTSTS